MPGVFLIPAALVTLAAYSLERLLFLLWNLKSFDDLGTRDVAAAFLHGLRFDLSAIVFISAPVILLSWLLYPWRNRRGLQQGLFWLFILVHLPFQVLSGIDTELTNFVGRRMTTETVFMLGEAQGKFGAMAGLMLRIGIPFFALVGLWMFLSRRAVFAERWQRVLGGARPRTHIVAQALLIGGIVVAARGGFQRKPIGFAHAQIFLTPALNNLSLNSAFTVIRSWRREPLPRDHFFDDRNTMLGYLNGAVTAPSLLDSIRPRDPQNIVLIIFESLNFEYMGAPHGDAGATPFLDELATRSLLFTNAYANGRRSIEGVPAVLTGIPSLMVDPFISSQYTNNHFWGVGTLLSKKNYHTSFFHGAHNGSMYFDQFAQRAGVRSYYAFNEFPDKSQDNGSWGIWDEPFFQWVAHKYTEFPQPFFSTIFTLSSHHPYKVPPAYEKSIPKGNLDILQAIQYTDLSLRKFFAFAETQPWYKNTLFILTADHTHQSWRPQYDNEIGRYRVPIMLFHPTLKLPRMNTREVTSQIDILPTIVDFAGLDPGEQNYLGRSLFIPGPRSAINHLEGRFQLMKGEYFMEYHRGGAFRMFAQSDPAQRHALTEPSTVYTDLENTLKASMQYFSEGLWDNRMYYPTDYPTGKH